MINLDETHHKKASEGDRGGSWSTTLTNPDLPRTGTRYAKDSGNHVSGCYGMNCLEPMPPVFIYSTTSTKEENMKIRPEWVDGLPIVKGQFGFGKLTAVDSLVSVRKKGSMDEDLYIQTICCTKSSTKPR